MHHRLLILGPKERQPFRGAEFNDSLAQTGDVAVTENTPDTADESALQTISLDELARYESDNGLPGG
jgi:hypothetical protein